jgi:hypothetical protein
MDKGTEIILDSPNLGSNVSPDYNQYMSAKMHRSSTQTKHPSSNKFSYIKLADDIENSQPIMTPI